MQLVHAQMSMKFQLPIKGKIVNDFKSIALKVSYVLFILLINETIPTTVGNLTFMLSWAFKKIIA